MWDRKEKSNNLRLIKSLSFFGDQFSNEEIYYILHIELYTCTCECKKTNFNRHKNFCSSDFLFDVKENL